MSNLYFRLMLLLVAALFRSNLLIDCHDGELNISRLSLSTGCDCQQSHTVDIPKELKDSLRKFRFARRSQGSAALVIKINKAKLIMEEMEQFDNISIEGLAEGIAASFLLKLWDQCLICRTTR